MANTKKIFTRTVTLEQFTASSSGMQTAILPCAECGHSTEMVPLTGASAESGISMRTLFRISETGLIHSIETANGQIMICRESLNCLKQGVENE